MQRRSIRANSLEVIMPPDAPDSILVKLGFTLLWLSPFAVAAVFTWGGDLASWLLASVIAYVLGGIMLGIVCIWQNRG